MSSLLEGVHIQLAVDAPGSQTVLNMDVCKIEDLLKFIFFVFIGLINI